MAKQADIAAHLDLAERTVRELRDKGVLPDLRAPLGTLRVQYIRHLREVAAGRASSSGDGTLDLATERARLAKEQADGQELKNAVQRGELIPAGDNAETVITLASVTAQRLQGVPTKAAPLAHAAETIKEAEAAIRSELDEALNSLADAAQDISAATLEAGG